MRKILLLLSCLVLAAGCSTIKRHDDAVRIRPEKALRYERAPGSLTTRDGRTLRGTVVEVQILPNPEKAGVTDTTVVFLNEGLPDRPENYERIPVQDLELVGTLFNAPRNEYGNINVFESFNKTETIPFLRSVPVKVVLPNDCGCLPLSFDLSIQPPSIRCPEREYNWFFVETRGIYALYNDQRTRLNGDQGREALQGEIATGFRLGAFNEWGIGLAYTSPLFAYNSFAALDAARPTALLHMRYQMARSVTDFLGLCVKPFAYGQFGATIDRASINLFKLNFAPEDCNDCNQLISGLKASGRLPEVDFSLPLTYGLGLGIDIPVSRFLDLSFDLGWRSQGFAEEAAIAGFENVPSQRRLNIYRLRMGITY